LWRARNPATLAVFLLVFILSSSYISLIRSFSI
jgi:hypothetical protein